MKSTKIIALLLVVVMCVGILASCDIFGCKHNYVDGKCEKCGEADPNYQAPAKEYTYNTYVTLSPSNWNELTYQDANDTEVLGWIQSSFFTYDFKYDENGEIVPGEFDIKYSAATKLEDVSSSVDESWDIPEGGKGYAYKITLRDDLKWENGDPIVAGDFVYSMQEQLNPLFQNYRANSYYDGATIIVNAQNYVLQGQSGWFGAHSVVPAYSADVDASIKFKLGPASKDSSDISYIRSWLESQLGTSEFDAATAARVLALNFFVGSQVVTTESLSALEGKTMAEIKADPAMKAVWDEVIGWWKTEPNEELHFFISEYTYPTLDFSKVGLYAESDTELVIVLAKPLDLFKEDGSLSYKAAYNMSSLPLVHKATYEANKVAPSGAATLWTSKYNSSKETTMSWGPYKLESFQTGGQFTLVKNDNWYGYNMPENEGLYQTTKIVYDVIADWNSAWIKFQAGELDGIGIDVTIADDYKGSDQAFFTPRDFVSSLQLQSDVESLQKRGEEEGVNKMLLAYNDFRQALSLAINRDEFTAKCTTSSMAGYGLFNSMHYYDVANGGVFRETDEAKQVLCDIYGVDVSKYESLDAAVDSITGYNLTLARELVTKAYNEALQAGHITATDKVKLTFGTGAIDESVQRQYDYIANSWAELMKGTPLEGRFELELADKGTTWATDFQAGGYDVCMGGWQGAAWDPGYFLLAYLSPDYMFSQGWDTSAAMMTFTMEGVKGEDGKDITDTMSLMDWYDCLNGNEGCKYDFSSNALEESQRLQLIAALEKEVLRVYYSVPLANAFSASLISYQVDYITYEYNTFMGYGGLKYMTYNFDDAAWEAEVAKYDGELNYK